MKSIGLVVLVAVVIFYSALGGVIFHYLENNNEQEAQVNIVRYIQEFQKNFTCLSEDDVARLLKEVEQAHDSGVSVKNRTDSGHTKWDFGSAIFFSVTVITTIGYGQISPVTVGGRVFCAIYAFVGIPLFLITAGLMGDQLRKVGNKIQERAACKALGNNPKVLKTLTTLLVVTIGFFLFMVVPACCFMKMESWTFLEAMYYVYISLTTIGFGDLVPGTSEVSTMTFYKLGIAVWIFVGLTWMAGVIATVQDIFSEAADKAKTKVSIAADAVQNGDKLEDKNTHDDLLKHDPEKPAEENTVA